MDHHWLHKEPPRHGWDRPRSWYIICVVYAVGGAGISVGEEADEERGLCFVAFPR